VILEDFIAGIGVACWVLAVLIILALTWPTNHRRRNR
jgi:hypothetical protein